MAEEELYSDDLDEDYDESESYGESDDDGLISDPEWGPTVTVNGTTYAVTLYWSALNNVSDPYEEVQETIHEMLEGSDLFCVRSGTSPQYGIGSSAEGHKPGMPSAAAAVAEIYQDKPTFVAMFRVEEGYWLVAVRTGVILAENDYLYKNEDDAKKAFKSVLAMPDWERRIAPADWEIEGTEEVELAKILKSPRGSKLQRVDKSHQKKMQLMIGGGALLFLIIIYNMFGSAPAPKRKLGPIKPLAPIEVEEEKPIQFVEVKPWEKLHNNEDFLARCYAGVQQVKSMVIPGWTVGDIMCTHTGLSTSWTMKTGHLGWLKRAFEEYSTAGLDYAISEAGTGAVVTISLGEIPLHNQQPKYMTFESRELLTDIFQAIKLPITFGVSSVRSEIPTNTMDDNGEKKVLVKLYNYLEFHFASDIMWQEWLSVFNQFPALELTKLDYNIENNTWNYEGRIYEPSL